VKVLIPFGGSRSFPTPSPSAGVPCGHPSARPIGGAAPAVAAGRCKPPPKKPSPGVVEILAVEIIEPPPYMPGRADEGIHPFVVEEGLAARLEPGKP